MSRCLSSTLVYPARIIPLYTFQRFDTRRSANWNATKASSLEDLSKLYELMLSRTCLNMVNVGCAEMGLIPIARTLWIRNVLCDLANATRRGL